MSKVKFQQIIHQHTLPQIDILELKNTIAEQKNSYVKKTKGNKCWRECEEKGTLGATLGRNTNWCSYYGNSIEAPQKLNHRMV